MLSVALKNLWAHKLRSMFLALCIVLGVSFVAGTYVLTDTVTATFNDIFASVYERTDLTVRSVSDLGTDAERRPVPESVLTSVRGVEGVADAQGSVFAIGAEIVSKDGKRVGNPQAPTFGLEWSRNDALTPLKLRAGRKPSGPNEVAIDARSFADSGYALGDTVTIITSEGPAQFDLVGVAGFGKADNIAGATLAVFDTPTAQAVMNRQGVFDSISIQAQQGVNLDALGDRVQQVLPEQTEVVTAQTLTSESSDALKKNLAFFRTFMLVFAYVALFVGAFIIYNTFSILVAQRTRELGLLRAIGAASGQLLAAVVLEALLIGLLASAAGVLAGIGLAAGLRWMLDQLGFTMPSGSTVILARTLVVSLVGGTVITVLSSLAPAIRAGRVPPVVAMQGNNHSSKAVAVRRNLVGLAAVIVGLVALFSGLNGNAVAQVGIGALLIFLGVAMLAPMVARPVASVLGAPLRARGVSGELARENSMRSARRTATTASALMIGTALMGASLVLSSSISRSVQDAVTRGAVAELVIRNDSQVGFSPAVADTARSTPGVSSVFSYRIGSFKIGNATKQLTAIDPAGIIPDTEQTVLDIGVRQGDAAALNPDGLAVLDRVATDRGWRLGDRVDVTFPDGPRELTVVATYNQNQLAGDYVVSLQTYGAHYSAQQDFLVLLRTAAGAPVNEVQQAVAAKLADGYVGVKVQTADQYVGDIKKQLNSLLSLITALLSFAVLIALAGVAIAMLLAVYERTREIGLLRAIGMSRRQLRSMVRWEAAIISLYGAMLGAALGLFLGWALTRALRDQGIGVTKVPVPSFVILTLVIVLLGVAAALFPARRAGRLNILDAIASE